MSSRVYTVAKRLPAPFGNASWFLIAPTFVAYLMCFSGCSSSSSRFDFVNERLMVLHIQEKIRTAASSVVGISVSSEYRVEMFHHEIRNGEAVPDPTSPTHYRLQAGALGISTSYKNQDVYGAGLVIFQDPRRAVVLTSRHILLQPDTVNSFCLDSAGNETDILYSRAVRTHSVYQVVGATGRWHTARPEKTDPHNDLGLMIAETEGVAPLPFPYDVAYDRKMDWGDLVFVFGNPRGIRQLTVGITSPSPYPGTFAVDAAARFGFSGGPVFVATQDGELSLVGIIRGAQVSKLQYITPSPRLLPGQYLTQEDLKELKAEEYSMIEFGVAYALNAEAIGSFLSTSVQGLGAKGISLPSRFFPKH
jgi:S1-C subfamily serine protease